MPSLEVLVTPSGMPSRLSWSQERDGNSVPETTSGLPSIGVPPSDRDGPDELADDANADRNGSSRTGTRRRMGNVASQFRARAVRCEIG